MFRKSILTIVCLLLVACQQERVSPEDVFHQFMTSFKEGNIEQMGSFFNSPINIDDQNWMSWLNREDVKDIKEELKEIINETRYSILDSDVVLPEGVLTVKVNTRNYGKLVDELKTRLVSNYLLNSNQLLVEDIIDLIEDVLDDDYPSYEKEIKVYLIYDNGWRLDINKNEALFDSLTGEAYTKLKAILS